VFPTFTDALDRELTKNGVAVTYKTYAGVDHAGAVLNQAPARDATKFVKARLSR
jgi:dienelactone hydrolase